MGYSIVQVKGQDYLDKKSIEDLQYDGWKQFVNLDQHYRKRLDVNKAEWKHLEEEYRNVQIVMVARKATTHYLVFKGENASSASYAFGRKLAKMLKGTHKSVRWLPSEKYSHVWKGSGVILKKDHKEYPKPSTIYKVKGMKDPVKTRPNHSDVTVGTGRNTQ